jgi:hypothetical protein
MALINIYSNTLLTIRVTIAQKIKENIVFCA